MRFLASSRVPRLGSPSRRVPRRRRLPSLGFHNPSTVFTPGRLTGLFHPARTSRLFPPGVFLAGSSLDSSSSACPLVVTCGLPPVSGRAPVDSTSGPSSPRKFVASDLQLSRSNARSPHGLSPLQGLLPTDRGGHFGSPPLSSFLRRPYWTVATGSSGSSRAGGWDHLSRDDQPS